jgi:NitT/TauT family transport system permease protein
MKSRIRGILGTAIAIATWEVIAKVKCDPAIVPVEGIVSASLSVASSSEFAKNLASTLRILLSGVALASVAGFLAAVFAVFDYRIWEMAGPTIEVCRNIPSITLFPILLVMYGIGDASRVFVIFWTAFPPVLLASIRGLSTIDIGVVEAGMALGMSDAQIMKCIRIPLASPAIMNGVRIGAGSGFVAIVVAEMLGATSGIGYMVLWTTNSFRYPETYVYILTIGFLGMAVNYVMEKAEKRLERKCS